MPQGLRQASPSGIEPIDVPRYELKVRVNFLTRMNLSALIYVYYILIESKVLHEEGPQNFS